ncbi:hypothetical protein GJW-30_1_03711 [Variibacter gotjawalensis]|uniref:Methyltransferase type 12 domain-containing protein n=1 Tax=Variibacter gotjawalensis TaxID=1333996 RepID=A0A0S3PZ12_9BRAD|nr:class I SAM-dependent methyltransferase [Variibacter gotjawalensis]NIK46991.1 trans-aconitate methyltransferase [Variibacter gotjawalensis]RZS48895.1 methyltransferase family protein [Variibacter gotjawalensis]BAT61154.1 hypothetical protein GJW-30_1_03711 [Variibacter gotjawalensis]
MSTPTKVDFDQYAKDYVAMLEDQRGMYGGERSYFSEYKIQLLSRLVQKPVSTILDFGAGIGLSIPYLKQYFPSARIAASDISEGSLNFISERHPDVDVIADRALSSDRSGFDLVLLITVLHHVAVEERRALVKRLSNLLRPGGHLCIFEHNPYNPLTRRMVSTCPFDSDAVLLTRAEAVELVSEAGLRPSHQGYTLFVPHALRALRVIEPALTWLPLGGQYYVIASR